MIEKISLYIAQVTIGDEFKKNFLVTREAPKSIGEFISAILPQIYVISLILVLIYLIWGGYRYLISGGDPKAIAGAKAHLTWAIIGVIFITLAFALLQLINALLNNAFGN